jgi:hypothetical protein
MNEGRHIPDGSQETLEETGASEVVAVVRDQMQEKVADLRQGLRKLAAPGLRKDSNTGA